MQASKKSDIFFGATCKNEALTFLVGVSFFITEIDFEFSVFGYETGKYSECFIFEKPTLFC